ncbi:hypothetical protein HanXRQr2_Chr13g0611501 [Helianthus annuus]|uniref:Uncharacterized protein n=1 Tax=Helianthus annuus TaxID=4232 RepID=A0A9K3EKP6_HELAN|nr:hypothetical protein HanXRQr2_Chr13g0611501 [Helianthus annuus]
MELFLFKLPLWQTAQPLPVRFDAADSTVTGSILQFLLPTFIAGSKTLNLIGRL